MMPFRPLALVFTLFLLTLSACLPQSATPTALPTANNHPPTATATPTLSPSPTPIHLPADINPLSGLPVSDPTLLSLPALLVSISHFPATGRPQAGLSFAPFVYEIYITEGATRFLAVYYGEFPAPETPLSGECPIRQGAFEQTAALAGGRIWLDTNGNGQQDVGENGIGGICVRLLDLSGQPLQETSSDSNGYYGFNITPGTYWIEIHPPAWAQISPADQGQDSRDSDVNPQNGRAPLEVQGSASLRDVGLIPRPEAVPPPTATLPAAQIGPIRSGRLVYGHLANSYPHSCLIFAGASGEVLVHLPYCYLVYHQLSGGGYMLDLSKMRQLAEEQRQSKGSDFNYTSNLFSDDPPAGGVPARRLDVYIAYQNQSAWVYDPLYRAYLRYVDTSKYELAGILHPEIDRLTGRQLHFENVIVLFAEHEVISPTNLDIHLEAGRSGKALLFRDGQMYPIRWRMDDKNHRPLAFLDENDRPFPLKPGHTWVLVVTPQTQVDEKSSGNWFLRFVAPAGAK